MSVTHLDDRTTVSVEELAFACWSHEQPLFIDRGLWLEVDAAARRTYVSRARFLLNHAGDLPCKD